MVGGDARGIGVSVVIEERELGAGGKESVAGCGVGTTEDTASEALLGLEIT